MGIPYEPCPYKDCRYHREGESFHLGNCRYLEMTGQSRILGLTLEQAMDKANCSRYEPRSGKAKPVRRSPVRMDHTNAQIRELYDQGWYDKAIAETLGISRSRVGNWRKRNKLPVNKEPPPTRFDWAKGMRLYRQGFSDVKIAEALDCSVGTVRTWRKRRELPANFAPFGRDKSPPSAQEEHHAG